MFGTARPFQLSSMRVQNMNIRFHGRGGASSRQAPSPWRLNADRMDYVCGFNAGLSFPSISLMSFDVSFPLPVFPYFVDIDRSGPDIKFRAFCRSASCMQQNRHRPGSPAQAAPEWQHSHVVLQDLFCPRFPCILPPIAPHTVLTIRPSTVLINTWSSGAFIVVLFLTLT